MRSNESHAFRPQQRSGGGQRGGSHGGAHRR
jgi:hypothetical protein